MGAVETRVLGGVKARIFRLSFAGELGFEIAVPAHKGEALARALLAAGAEWDVTFYGLEALAVMRIEKGHVSGPELNGQTTAADLGFGRMASTKKDYIGRVLAGRPRFARCAASRFCRVAAGGSLAALARRGAFSRTRRGGRDGQ